MGGAANSRLAARVLSGAEDEGVGVGVGGLVGEIEGEAGGVLVKVSWPAPMRSTRWMGLGRAEPPRASVLMRSLPLAGQTKAKA